MEHKNPGLEESTRKKIFLFQIDKFRHQVHRNYANETDRDISDDYRPVQRLNNRVVMTNAEDGLYYNNCKINLPFNFYFMVLLFLLISKL